MRYARASILFLAVGACAGGQEEAAAARPTSLAGGHPFPVSCTDEAGRLVERGVALLHHMAYEDADGVFAAATDADPDCAMGYWGRAATYIHPLWSDPPDEATFARGSALIARARSRGRKTGRERAFIAAVGAYYAGGWSRDEAPHLAALCQGWDRARRLFPDDVEATAFHVLALLAIADPGDRSYRTQRQAGELAEQVLAVNPLHPGAHHYLLHAYDAPPLAERALTAARRYGALAPEAPHALHLPTHIFTRLALWSESIEGNRRSAEAATAHPAGAAGTGHRLHALDYLAYAHLQRGEDQQAEDVLRTVASLDQGFEPELEVAYALAAVPARLALERQRWTEAMGVTARAPADFPWDQFPAMEALSRFARAMGGARAGDVAMARAELAELAALRVRAERISGPYWARQVEIQRLAALAWLEYQTGRLEQALATMRSAAELEASTGRHPVTPGEILPARELLADLLLALGRHHEALIEFEAALRRSPGRLNSLFGAGRAAELAGNRAQAEVYYRRMVAAAGTGRGPERLEHARAFLAAR